MFIVCIHYDVISKYNHPSFMYEVGFSYRFLIYFWIFRIFETGGLIPPIFMLSCWILWKSIDVPTFSFLLENLYFHIFLLKRFLVCVNRKRIRFVGVILYKIYFCLTKIFYSMWKLKIFSWKTLEIFLLNEWKYIQNTCFPLILFISYSTWYETWYVQLSPP